MKSESDLRLLQQTARQVLEELLCEIIALLNAFDQRISRLEELRDGGRIQQDASQRIDRHPYLD